MEGFILSITKLCTDLGIFGILIPSFFIIFESIIPILPSSAFIALNAILFGTIPGFVLSWGSTVIGSVLVFIIVRKYLKDKKKLTKIQDKCSVVEKISFPNLVLIISLPFTPMFLVNFGVSFSDMEFRKFLYSIIIGKFFMVFFWTRIGTTLLESLTDVTILVQNIIFFTVVYIVSKLINKKFKLK